jgi:hypothetical protein
MRRDKYLATVLALTLLTLSPQARALGQNESGEHIVPKDTVFALELLSPLSTETNKKDDKFDCKVLSPVQYAGAIVSGHLRGVKNAGKGTGKSEIDLAFDTITLADGRTGKIKAQVKEVNEVRNAGNEGVADSEGTVKGKSKVKIGVKRAAIGAGIGAGIGAVFGGAKGAAAGAAIGASVGVTSTLVTEGPNLEFKSGTQFTVVLNSPAQLKNPAPM